MKPDTELEALMLRYQGGDLLAATALVKDLSPSLYKLFAVHTMSRQHTDDLLQETWLRIHHVRHTYRPGERFLPWLYAIARHVRVDHYRRLRRVAHREQQLDDVPEPGAKSLFARNSSEVDMATLLATLPDSQREVVSMLKIADMSLEDVARATSSTVGSVKQKAHRAYSRLRELLAGTEHDPIRSGEIRNG
jgi:RNA polymerase sigma-70 factor (ECF subfamily)